MKTIIAFALTLISINLLAQEGELDIKIPFSETVVPAAPDYSNPDHWCSLPTKQDQSDVLPKGSNLKDNQANAQVDVFFVHPTTLQYGPSWNGDLNDQELNDRTDNLPIKYQSTVFNGSCRVYAPRYRQGHIRAFFNYFDGGEEALNIAYGDVAAAFDYYMAHYNNGRPFIIASHSQGTMHAVRLIREKIEGTPLMDQMVTAYVVGMPVRDTSFNQLPICETPTQTGCYTSWGTFAENYYPPNYDTWIAGANMVNPVTWTTDTTWVDNKSNLGFVGKQFKVRQGIWDTKVHESLLWVGKPHIFLGKLLNRKNFHIADYNLFWMDIRENVALRVNTYLSQPHARGTE